MTRSLLRTSFIMIIPREVVIGASIGIALSPGDGTTGEELLRNADMALYRAKQDGRGVYRFFEPEMDRQATTGNGA